MARRSRVWEPSVVFPLLVALSSLPGPRRRWPWRSWHERIWPWACSRPSSGLDDGGTEGRVGAAPPQWVPCAGSSVRGARQARGEHWGSRKLRSCGDARPPLSASAERVFRSWAPPLQGPLFALSQQTPFWRVPWLRHQQIWRRAEVERRVGAGGLAPPESLPALNSGGGQ